MTRTRRLALRLSAAASWLTPARRRTWASAMAAEVDSIDADAEALRFAAGCLWAAAQQRLAGPIVVTGRLAVGGVTLLFAGIHLRWAANGVQWLLGEPDPFCETLIASGQTAVAQAHAAAHPWIVAYLAGMGLGHLLAGFFLIVWRPRLFMAAVAVAAIAATFTLWPFVPLTMLVGAAAIFHLIDPARRDPFGAA